jgi:vesicle coat complex subunit
MTSIIRVGQSKFVTHPIDEDSQERILNCIQTLSELKEEPSADEVFTQDTKAAYSKMLSAQEVNTTRDDPSQLLSSSIYRKRQPKRGKRKQRRRPLCRLMIYYRSVSSTRKAQKTLLMQVDILIPSDISY